MIVQIMVRVVVCSRWCNTGCGHIGVQLCVNRWFRLVYYGGERVVIFGWWMWWRML